jgi:hypothetical protein
MVTTINVNSTFFSHFKLKLGENPQNSCTFVCFSFSEITACVIENLQNPDLKTGETFLQDKLSQMPTSSTSSTRVSQIWSTMHLKLDFPRCKDSYVPHNFQSAGPFRQFSEFTRNFSQAMNFVAKCLQKVVLITAPPGMGKSRASEEMYTQLVLRGHFVIYAKLSQIISFWTKCGDSPSVKAFLQECMDDDKLQQCPEGDKMIVVLDGFDEICPHFRSKVLALIKELLVEGSKVLITSRPQEEDQIIKALEKDTGMFILMNIEPFSLEQKVLMLQTRLNLDANKLAKI